MGYTVDGLVYLSHVSEQYFEYLKVPLLQGNLATVWEERFGFGFNSLEK